MFPQTVMRQEAQSPQEGVVKYSVYAIAESLRRNHGFDFDIAFLSAWYGAGNHSAPVATPAQVVDRMMKARNCPRLSEEQAKQMLAAYAARKKSPNSWQG